MDLGITKSSKSKLLFILYFAVLCFILYGNTVYNSYSLDDEIVTANNPMIQKGIKGIPEIFTTLYQNQENFKYEYRPIVKLTYAMEYQIFKSNPGVSHFFNIFIYFLIALLLFHLLQKIFSDYALFFSLAITTLFIAHPIHTEVVASLKNRDELLSFFFSLLTVYYTIKLGKTRKKKYILISSLFFTIALLSKQSAMVFAAICPLTLYFTDKKVNYKYILYLFIVFVIAYFSLKLFQKNLISETIKEKFLKDNPLKFYNSFDARTATAMMVLFFYTKILIFPHPLLFYYGYNMIPVASWNNIVVIILFVLHLIILAFALYKLKSRHPISYGILFYLICISMFTNILRPAAGIVAERYAFAATLGLCIVIISILFSVLKIHHTREIKRSQKYWLSIPILAILIPYSIKTIARNFEWKDHITLYSADIPYLKNSSKANELYASELMRQVNQDMLKTKNFERNRAKTELAVEHFKRSVEIDSSNNMAYNNLGLIYFVLYKNNFEALKYFKSSFRYKPNYEKGIYNTALVYENQKDFDSAIFYYQKVINNGSKNQYAYSNLANIYFNEKHDIKKAIEVNNLLAKADPDNALPFINIGGYYLKTADTVTCLTYFEKAAEKPNIQPEFLMALSQLYSGKGNSDKASYYNEKAMSIKLNRKKKLKN